MTRVLPLVAWLCLLQQSALAQGETPTAGATKHTKRPRHAPPPWQRRAESLGLVLPTSTFSNPRPDPQESSSTLGDTNAKCVVFGPHDYLHDGAYLRLSFGLSYVSIWGNGPAGRASLSGQGSSFSVRFGGTIASSLVLGAVLEVTTVSDSFHGAPAGAPGEADGGVPLLGMFGDWYPNPRGGWHVGSSLGLGGYSFRDTVGRDYTAVSPTFAPFGGYDNWIGPQYSLGLSAIASFAPSTKATDRQGNDTFYRFAVAYFGLQTSLLWH
ncbi:MAG TPA: hypothetical protein VGI10_31455 [Polyangiaceae bacterium]|jgi:hypothetical protein